MNSFPDFPSESMGGCSGFLFAPRSYFMHIPPVVNDVLPSDPVFRSGLDWLDGLALRDTLQFAETVDETASGPIYKTTISGMVPKLTAAYLTLFNTLRRYRHNVLITDNNGESRFCGHNHGMAFSFGQDSAPAPAGTGGFKFTFYCEWYDPSPFYTPPIS